MALDFRLYNASYLIELDDDSVYGLVWGGALGMPEASRIYSQSWGRGYSPLAAIDYQGRQATLVIQLKATSLDNWITTFRQIEQLLLDVQRYYAPRNPANIGLEGDRAVLSVQLNGMTYPLEFDVLDGECNADAIINSMMQSTTRPTMLRVPIPLSLKPFGRPQQLSSVTSGTITNGGGVAGTSGLYQLAAPNGDMPTPVKVTFQSAAGDPYQHVIIGKKVGSTNFIWQFNLETASTPAGYTVAVPSTGAGATQMRELVNTSVAGAHAGNVLRVVPNTASFDGSRIATWTINDNLQDFYGKYRVYLRMDQTTTGNTGAWQLKYGGASGDAITNNSATFSAIAGGNTSDTLTDLGVMEIPYRFTPLDVPQPSFLFSLYLSRGSHTVSATDRPIDLDCVYLVPINEGFLDIILPNANAAAQDQLISDRLQLLPSAYLVDASGDLQGDRLSPYTHTFFDVDPAGVNQWYALATRAGTSNAIHDLTDQFTLKFEYQPYFALGRTTT